MLEEPIQPIDIAECQLVGIAVPCSIMLEIVQMGILNLEENISAPSETAEFCEYSCTDSSGPATDSIYLTFASTCAGLSAESRGMCIFDCACTRTVAGSRWFYENLKMMPVARRKNVQERLSSATILFGDGKVTKCLFTVSLPVSIRRSRLLFGVRNCGRMSPSFIKR